MKPTGVVVEPLVGSVGTFRLGNHSNGLTISGIPWFAHAWNSQTPIGDMEDLPNLGEIDGFNAAVWTSSEIVFFGGSNGAGRWLGTTAAYTPVQSPGQ